MKQYRLVEKTERTHQPIVYRISGEDTLATIVQEQSYLKVNKEFAVGVGITETKRGWTYYTAILTGDFIKVFLPRGRFEKVEIDE